MGGIAVIVLAVILLIIAVTIYRSHYGIGSVSVRFQTESGSTVRAGHGGSVGTAVVDGFRKLYESLSLSSRIDTIESRLTAMRRTLSDNRYRMRSAEIETCESYIRMTSDLLNRKKEELSRQEEKKKSARLHAEEAKREKQQERRAKEAEKVRIRREREKSMPEHRRFVAEQRRLMTDSLRYDVLRRDGFRCQLCGATADDGYKLHVDHIIPVSKGGKTELSNLRTLCERCNMGKSNKIESSDDLPRTASILSVCDTARQMLKGRNLEYVDKTSAGGALYFFSSEIADELKQKGFAGSYAPNGTKGTAHRAAWFVK